MRKCDRCGVSTDAERSVIGIPGYKLGCCVHHKGHFERIGLGAGRIEWIEQPDYQMPEMRITYAPKPQDPDKRLSGKPRRRRRDEDDFKHVH